MAAPAYIKARISEGLIKCVRLQKFSDGCSCSFEYNEIGKKPLYPSTGKHPRRVWLTQSDVIEYVKGQIGWTGPIYDNYNNNYQ